MNVSQLMTSLRSGNQTIEEMFTVTAAGGAVPAGLSVLDALCNSKGLRVGEKDFEVYQAICRIVVKAAKRIGMLDHMGGKRGDTPLMKACAVGNDVIVELLLTHRAGFSHLGLITPPVSLVILSGLTSYDLFWAGVEGKPRGNFTVGGSPSFLGPRPL